MQTDRIADLELLLGHHFRDKGFIENALSHSSIKAENRPSNERLEFLGDSVLGLVVADALYRRFPTDDEGTLTRIKSQAVSRATLQRIALAMGLDRYILVGRGVAKREIPASLLGNLFEAIVGAIYLDSGLSAARKFILRHLDVVIDEIVEDRAERNYKSMLQHYGQRDLGGVPTYRVVREWGPAHGRAFEVAILVNGKEYGRAKAASKKEAEQGAARAALIHLRQVDEDPNVETRGAGVVVRVGDGSKKKRRKRGGRRAAAREERAPPAAAAPERGVEEPAPVRSPGLERQSSRRRRGGRRAQRKSRDSTKQQEQASQPEHARATEPEPAAPSKAPGKKAPKKRTTKKAAKKAPRKRTRKKTSRRKKSGGEAAD